MPRRAVRIAPMGVVPLPPPHSGGPLVTPEMNAQGGGGIMATAAATAAAAAAVAAVAVSTGTDMTSSTTEAVGSTGTIGEMPKGKRRGVTGATSVSNEALTPEERTKQKRMLRNRESAARSRDKQKTKNLQLESSIEKYNTKKELLAKTAQELRKVVEEMREVLKSHKVAVPF